MSRHKNNDRETRGLLNSLIVEAYQNSQTEFCVVIVLLERFSIRMVLTTRDTRTLAALIPTLQTEVATLWGELVAVAVIAVSPIFTIFAQRYLIRGLTAGAVKGYYDFEKKPWFRPNEICCVLTTHSNLRIRKISLDSDE